MKKIILLLIMTNVLFASFSQTQKINSIKSLTISKETIHIISPEPVQYVDISSTHFTGDIPVDNMVRLKYSPSDSSWLSADKSALVTVAGQSFYAQYEVNYNAQSINPITSHEIQDSDKRPLNFPRISISHPELKQMALGLLTRKTKNTNKSAKHTGVNATLNNIYAVGDYLFFDISFENKSNLPFDTSEIQFKIKDKRRLKATNEQILDIKPEFQLYKKQPFRKTFRNIYVFKKFTFPNNKALSIQISENQISGRYVELKIDFKHLLQADTI